MAQQSFQINTEKVVDLTHPLNDRVPTWNGSCGFKKNLKCNYSDCTSQPQFLTHSLEMQAGVGTHIDAPCHCFKGKKCITDIALSELVLPLIVIDVSSKADADYEISSDDIIAFEKAHGNIPADSLFIGYTGWSKYWNDPVRYRNADANGELHFPSFGKTAAEILLERGVVGLAIDTLSPDRGVDGYYPAHELFLGAGKYIVENVANAHLLPPIGTLGVLLPMSIAEGSEAPVRFIAFIP